MNKILDILYQGNHLNQEQTETLFYNIIKNRLSPIQITAILISLKIKGETLPEIMGATNILLKYAKSFPTQNSLFADITGTGGDGGNTINISTISAIVASTCNVKIIKHGNRSISGLIGSMNFLYKNNYSDTHSNTYAAQQDFNTLGICFLDAPQYHTILQNIMPIRKQLKTPTLFNIIGPLTNPSRPPLTLIGVYKKELLLPMIQALKLLKYQRGAIVHCGGIDEVGLHDNTHVSELDTNGNIQNYILKASDFGLNPQPINKLYSHSLEQSVKDTINLLQGKGKPEHEHVIAANVALLLKLFGYNDLRANTLLALHKIRQGIPYTNFKKLSQFRI